MAAGSAYQSARRSMGVATGQGVRRTDASPREGSAGSTPSGARARPNSRSECHRLYRLTAGDEVHPPIPPAVQAILDGNPPPPVERTPTREQA